MDFIAEQLEKTSRTFALSIPLLPQPTRRQIGIAYLLFRIADTFEDAADWSQRQQIQALEDFCGLLRDADPERAGRLGSRWAREIPIHHEGYLELLRSTDRVLEEFFELSPEARGIVREHTVRTAQGMAGFVRRTDDGLLRLEDLDDLRGYCYVVAGIVGELSTELFLLDAPELEPVASDLRERAPRFGEGLQLVNILKDATFDSDEGRCYLPPRIPRERVFLLAREDLGIAADYTGALQECGAPRGVVAFCALPIRLAYAALDRVEEAGPGAKISRDKVWEIVAAMNEALDEGRPAVRAGVAAGG